MIFTQITNALERLGNEAQAAHLSRFFKTAEGEYGHGDVFMGVRVPQVRALVKEYRTLATLDDIEALTLSPFHEVRLAGFLLLIELYNQARHNHERRQTIVNYYMSILSRGNNWDLVDVVAPKILGAHLVTHPEQRHVLHTLATYHDRLWHRRVAVVSTWTLIRSGHFDDTIALAQTLLHDSHDLIQKAVGWMLREIGKRGGYETLIGFLDRYADRMPRTMLRYSIEQLSPDLRKHYLSMRRCASATSE